MMMMMPTSQPTHATDPSDVAAKRAALARSSGLLIVVTSIITIVFFAHHPRSAAEAMTNRVVHGVLIATIAALALGFSGFAQWLGLERMSVRAGFAAYIVGALALIAAATINGFLLLDFIELSGGSHADSAANDAAVNLAHLANHACDHLGVMALSIAVLMWSIALLAHRGWLARVLAAAGLLVGVVPPVLLLGGNLPMSLHGFGAFLLAQMLWSMGVGALLLWRGGE